MPDGSKTYWYTELIEEASPAVYDRRHNNKCMFHQGYLGNNIILAASFYLQLMLSINVVATICKQMTCINESQ